jgi:hypothetical protein
MQCDKIIALAPEAGSEKNWVEESAAKPNLDSVIETFFYILRKRARLGRALQVPEKSFFFKKLPQSF